MLASRPLGDGLRQIDLSAPAVHCGGCIQAIETGLRKLDGVEHARVNLSSKRVSVRWRGETPPPLAAALDGLGYVCHVFDGDPDEKDETFTELIRGVAVSGLASANIMLLSVSVWSGAEEATRDLFHWLSALIVIPALVFGGRIFFRSAWSALSHGRMNMDVPIAVGVAMAFFMSIYETINHGPHAYFDASASLLFFLLIGRTLDHVMRDKARVAVKGLAKLGSRGAMTIRDDGSRDYVPVGEIEPGMKLLIAAGERVPVDALVVAGNSDLDVSLVTGESHPQGVSPGSRLQAGTLNLTGPLTLEAVAAARDSFLAEMVRLMEAAEGGRARYRRIADRASALYAPLVHLTAFVTFLGWMAASGDWHRAITIAIAVLIITCPCALGLAVPIVQVVAARRLFEKGVMVKDGSAMERLAEVDSVVFDKTGTLTLGRPKLTNAGDVDPDALEMAAAIAAHSRHPLSMAIARLGNGRAIAFDRIAEAPGLGMEASLDGATYRLGRSEWALDGAAGSQPGEQGEDGTILSRDGKQVAAFHFEDQLRGDAAATVAGLKASGLDVEMLTGDRQAAAAAVAGRLGLTRFHAEVLPGDKSSRVATLAAAGRKVLMVGDGLNDAPALAAAHASMAPATAADVGRNAADFVFLRERLSAVPLAIEVSRKAGRLIRQNITFAICYNIVAVPIAVLGHVTPLVAAIAMSLSSVVVISNAMRLNGKNRRKGEAAPAGEHHAGGAMLAAAE